MDNVIKYPSKQGNDGASHDVGPVAGFESNVEFDSFRFLIQKQHINPYYSIKSIISKDLDRIYPVQQIFNIEPMVLGTVQVCRGGQQRHVHVSAASEKRSRVQLVLRHYQHRVSPVVRSAQGDAGGLRPYSHVMVALIDRNPHLGAESRTTLSTAAGMAFRDKGKLTVLFVDKESVDESRMTMVKKELESLGIEDVQILEEQVVDTSKASVAVGEAADEFGADVVVMSANAVHEKYVDANLLAEFVPAPLLLLP